MGVDGRVVCVLAEARVAGSTLPIRGWRRIFTPLSLTHLRPNHASPARLYLRTSVLYSRAIEDEVGSVYSAVRNPAPRIGGTIE